MNARQTFVRFVVTGCLAASVAIFLPTTGRAQDAKLQAAMELLKSKAAKQGPPTIEGTDTVAGKQVPAIYFGSTKIDNNFDLVDEVVKQVGGTATIFVKSGEEYVRVSTNVKTADGTRAVGTILDPKGKVIGSINKNEPFHGDVDILGKPYVTEYEPIYNQSHDVIGIYYVGYPK